LYGQGRVSLALWCHEGLIFSKSWVKNPKSVMDPSCQLNFCDHQQPEGDIKQESITFILAYGYNKQHCMDKEEFHWPFGVMRA
jgi:hypothetical protein